MLSKQQKQLLAELIHQRKEVLFAPFSTVVTKKLKQVL